MTSRPIAGTLLALAVALAACGDGGGGANADAGTSRFEPVTIEHRYGSTEITAAAKRVVTVGLTDHDALLALGLAPVGVTEWFGDYPHATWPWAQDELEALGAEPEVVGDAAGLNFEQIAALHPDAILALYSGITSEEYETLSAIAPTVAQPDEYVDYGIPWQELTRTVGQVVGRADEADALVEDVEARFAAVRGAQPEFAGATGLMVTPYEGYFVYGPEDPRGRLLTALGFELPAGLAGVTGDEFGASISPEQAELLDADVVVWLMDAGQDDVDRLRVDPVYGNLRVAAEGREVFLAGGDNLAAPVYGATSFVSVLSLPFLLDELVPLLADAVDGDPTTTVPIS